MISTDSRPAWSASTAFASSSNFRSAASGVANGRSFLNFIFPQVREFNDVVRRQNRANQISLRRGVNFIQMMLRFGLQHKPPDALVESAFDDHVGTRTEGGANALIVD